MDMFAVYDYGELSFSPALTRLRHNVPNVVDAGEDQGTVKMHHDELRPYRRLQIGDSESNWNRKEGLNRHLILLNKNGNNYFLYVLTQKNVF